MSSSSMMTYPLIYGWLSVETVLNALTNAHRAARHHHWAGCADALIAYADLVTEMREIKHRTASRA